MTFKSTFNESFGDAVSDATAATAAYAAQDVLSDPENHTDLEKNQCDSFSCSSSFIKVTWGGCSDVGF